MTVTKDQIKQFHEEGYCVFEKIISEQDLAGLRFECEKHLRLQIASMERVGAETLGLSHKEKRYTLPCRHEESPFLEGFLFGEVMMEIIKSLIGNDAYLFLELFAVKWPKAGLPFAWHQDSGYLLGNPHKPYISLWCALDDTTVENGTLWVLPYSRSGSREVVKHVREKETNDLVGYLGTDPGVAIPVLSGSVIAMSSLTFHRSGANITDKPRRAFLASYSPEPIADKNGRQWNLAVPFLKNGVRVFESTARSC
jgi:ectoine hydroxylase-related dioxygenase (phytanoyl-CoA dioxygenase family)